MYGGTAIGVFAIGGIDGKNENSETGKLEGIVMLRDVLDAYGVSRA